MSHFKAKMHQIRFLVYPHLSVSLMKFGINCCLLAGCHVVFVTWLKVVVRRLSLAVIYDGRPCCVDARGYSGTSVEGRNGRRLVPAEWEARRWEGRHHQPCAFIFCAFIVKHSSRGCFVGKSEKLDKLGGFEDSRKREQKIGGEVAGFVLSGKICILPTVKNATVSPA